MAIFKNWFNLLPENKGRARLWMLTENPAGRVKAFEMFCTAVRSHYDRLERIAEDIAELGFASASAILRERLPGKAKSKSGELGEIMATEFAEEYLDFIIPVRRIRYKDGRDMALRGDDFIGVRNNQSDLRLLKGESKSRQNLSKSTITKARTALDSYNGRCSPISLLFVADRLLEQSGANELLGKKLKAEVAQKSLSPDKIDHAFFTFSGNAPKQELLEDLKGADNSRVQNVINICVTDHQDFIKDTYIKVATLGNC